MIPLSALKDLFTVLPNSYITKPVHKNKETGSKEPDIVSWIKDRNGARIGSIDWDKCRIVIFEEYEYSDEVMQAIGAEKFSDEVSHFDEDDLSKTMEKSNEAQKELEEFLLKNSDDSPEQIAKLLYHDPKG